MNKYLQAAIAGTVATIFHTAVMLALHPRLPRARRRPLPPVEITATLADRAGAENVRDGTGRRAATAIAHFGFGAAAGALYAPIGARAPSRPALSGIAFGVGVWAASYLGWIPAARLLSPATRQPTDRNAMMILAHIAWGAGLGTVFNALHRHSPRR